MYKAGNAYTHAALRLAVAVWVAGAIGSARETDPNDVLKVGMGTRVVPTSLFLFLLCSVFLYLNLMWVQPEWAKHEHLPPQDCLLSQDNLLFCSFCCPTFTSLLTFTLFSFVIFSRLNIALFIIVEMPKSNPLKLFGMLIFSFLVRAMFVYLAWLFLVAFYVRNMQYKQRRDLLIFSLLF